MIAASSGNRGAADSERNGKHRVEKTSRIQRPAKIKIG